MINTLSKTLEAQEKIQDIEQSPSTKIGTKPDARSQRNELTEVTERWTGRSDQEARQKQRPDAEQQDRPDAGQQCPIEYRKVPERRNCDRTLTASDQLIAALTVETTGRVQSGRKQRPVNSRKVGFCPQRLLSQWGL